MCLFMSSLTAPSCTMSGMFIKNNQSKLENYLVNVHLVWWPTAGPGVATCPGDVCEKVYKMYLSIAYAVG